MFFVALAQASFAEAPKTQHKGSAAAAKGVVSSPVSQNEKDKKAREKERVFRLGLEVMKNFGCNDFKSEGLKALSRFLKQSEGPQVLSDVEYLSAFSEDLGIRNYSRIPQSKLDLEKEKYTQAIKELLRVFRRDLFRSYDQSESGIDSPLSSAEIARLIGSKDSKGRYITQKLEKAFENLNARSQEAALNMGCRVSAQTTQSSKNVLLVYSTDANGNILRTPISEFLTSGKKKPVAPETMPEKTEAPATKPAKETPKPAAHAPVVPLDPLPEPKKVPIPAVPAPVAKPKAKTPAPVSVPKLSAPSITPLPPLPKPKPSRPKTPEVPSNVESASLPHAREESPQSGVLPERDSINESVVPPKITPLPPVDEEMPAVPEIIPLPQIQEEPIVPAQDEEDEWYPLPRPKKLAPKPRAEEDVQAEPKKSSGKKKASPKVEEEPEAETHDEEQEVEDEKREVEEEKATAKLGARRSVVTKSGSKLRSDFAKLMTRMGESSVSSFSQVAKSVLSLDPSFVPDLIEANPFGKLCTNYLDFSPSDREKILNTAMLVHMFSENFDNPDIEYLSSHDTHSIGPWQTSLNSRGYGCTFKTHDDLMNDLDKNIHCLYKFYSFRSRNFGRIYGKPSETARRDRKGVNGLHWTALKQSGPDGDGDFVYRPFDLKFEPAFKTALPQCTNSYQNPAPASKKNKAYSPSAVADFIKSVY